MMLITAMYEGRTRTLTVPQWAKLLDVPKKKLYNRKLQGNSDQKVIEGIYMPVIKKTVIDENHLNKLYQAFNFSTKIWRKRNGV